MKIHLGLVFFRTMPTLYLDTNFFLLFHFIFYFILWIQWYKAHIPLNDSIIYFIKTMSLNVGHALKCFLRWVYEGKRKHHLLYTNAPNT